MLAGDQLASEVAPADAAGAAPAAAETLTLNPRAARAARGRGKARAEAAAAKALTASPDPAAGDGRWAGAPLAKVRSSEDSGARGSAAAVLECGTPPPLPPVPDAQMCVVLPMYPVLAKRAAPTHAGAFSPPGCRHRNREELCASCTWPPHGCVNSAIESPAFRHVGAHARR